MVSKDDVLNALKRVADPHMGISIVDMGLIQDVEVDGDGNVSFTLTPVITSYSIHYTKLYEGDI